MRYIHQLLIIVLVSFVGEALNTVIPLPVPASIYGLVLMLACLKSGVFPVSAVKETSGFLLEIMPLFFVAPGVAVLRTLPVLQRYWWQLLAVCVVSTVVVMVVTGHAVQAIIRLGRRPGGKEEE